MGDSRCYLIRDKKIEQLTVDHSLAQALVEAKTISPAEAKDHRFSNVLWKYLGSKEVGEGPEVHGGAGAGRRPLPALHRRPDRRRARTSNSREFVDEQTDMQASPSGLGQLALDQGSRDNVSCIVIEVVEG